MWSSFNQFLMAFAQQRCAVLKAYSQGEVAKLDGLSGEEQRNIQTSFEEKIRPLGARFSLCLNKCAVCYLHCVDRKGHNERTFEERKRLEQSMKELKGKLDHEMQKKIAETEARLASLKEEHGKGKAVAAALEKQVSTAEALENARARFRESSQMLREKEDEQKRHESSIQEQCGGTIPVLTDCLSRLASQKQALVETIRAQLEPVFGTSSIAGEIGQRFSSLTELVMTDKLAKLHAEAVEAAAFLDSMFSLDIIRDIDLQQPLELCQKIQANIGSWAVLVADAGDAGIEAQRSAIEHETSEMACSLAKQEEQKRKLEEKIRTISETYSKNFEELGRLTSEDARLTKLKETSTASSSAARQPAMETTMVMGERKATPDLNAITLPICERAATSDTEQEIAELNIHLQTARRRLDNFEKCGLDKEVEKRRQEIALIEAKLQLLAKATVAADQYNDAVHAEIKASIAELVERESVQASVEVRLQNEIYRLDKTLQHQQFEMSRLQGKHSELASKLASGQQQSTVSELVKIQTVLGTTLTAWKTGALELLQLLRTAASVGELATHQANRVTLLDQMKEAQETEERLKEQLGEVTSSADLVAKLQEAQKSEIALAREVDRLQSFIAANAMYAKLNCDLEKVNKMLECSCGNTDHRCDKNCSICMEDGEALKCKHLAGHLEGAHICNKEMHFCSFRCETKGCDKRCMYAAGHDNPANHKCSSTHQCTLPCRYCANTCTKSLVDEHEDHQCNEKRCPKRCIFCSEPCTGEHNHDETAMLIEDPRRTDKDYGYDDKAPVVRPSIKLHLCGNEHACQMPCVVNGVCEVHFVEETREWLHPLKPIQYQYIRPDAKRKKCVLVIPPGKCAHKGVHGCEKKEHICNSRCVQCASFCRETFGHDGEHRSANHRNMEFCNFVAKTRDGRITIEEITSGKKEVRIFEPGDPLMAETCMQQCKRKGRAHFHLIQCPGGARCGERVHGSGVKHCDASERFYPDVSIVYDKYLCHVYWRSLNWTAPVDKESADGMKLCNYYCPAGEHSPKDPSFCNLQAWHSSSSSARDHVFECHDFSKPSFVGLDICFCIDATGSMASYIKASKDAIMSIISKAAPLVAKLGTDASAIRFGIVAYRDHCDGPDILQKCPFTTGDAAVSFLGSVTATGGGDGPEAVLDGIDCGVNLAWRDGCSKLFIHILDAPPHGRQFTDMSDDNPGGCPCGKTENAVLRALREKGIHYNVIPLTNEVNKMIKVFESQIEVTSKTLSLPIDLPTVAADIACKALEDAELTATRIVPH